LKECGTGQWRIANWELKKQEAEIRRIEKPAGVGATRQVARMDL
jgi:hypothetical protein